ncbi:MAG: YfiR family protein [Woeseia sp.]
MTTAFVACLVIAASGAVRVEGQPIDSASEQSIKAAYLYKFADYVEWPDGVMEDPATFLTIGVVSADSLADELQVMTAGRKVHGRSIAVRRVGPQEPLDGVHILFVAAAGIDELARLTTMAQEHSVLVVTEVGDGLELGSVINFRPVNQRIRFDVSLESADRSRLRLSARLLAVAADVKPRSH